MWANDTTQYLGSITATGGELAGDGGAVEVSGKQTLLFAGAVDTSAPNGRMGSLLLDPENIVIVNGSNAADDDQLVDYSITADEGDDLFTISERTLSRLAVNSTLTLEANNDITVEPLLDQVLAFRPGTGAITLIADANGNGIGDFIMSDPDTTLIAPGRDVSISGVNLLLGDLNTSALFQGGTITLSATGSVVTKNIDTHAPQAASQSGNVNITAANITTQDIFTQSPGQSGNVTLVGEIGDVVTGELLTDSVGGIAGSVELSAANRIQVAGEVVQSLPAPEAEIPKAEILAPPVLPENPTPIDSPTVEASSPFDGTALAAAGLSEDGLARVAEGRAEY